MWDMWLSWGVKTLENSFIYKINNEQKIFSTIIWSAASHDVSEGDTISDSACFDPTYDYFWICIWKINKTYEYNEELNFPCNAFINSYYLEEESGRFFSNVINCPFINCYYSEERKDIKDININFLLLIIKTIINIENQVNSKLKNLDISLEEINDLENWFNNDENYIYIHEYDSTDNKCEFSSDFSIIGWEYKLKSNFGIVKIQINPEKWVNLIIEEKWINIIIDMDDINSFIEWIINTLNELHSDPWCE